MGRLQQVYDRLLAAYGPQSWWPGETPLEVLVGAVLVQNTAWPNAARAIDRLREADKLDALRLHQTPLEELEQLIRPAGVFRVKARRLKNLVALVAERYGGSLERMLQEPLPELRAELLAVDGVGPETADAILLYAGEKATFVVDAYTRRVLTRHGWAAASATYDQLKTQFEEALPRDAQMFNEYHALLVEVGKRHCRRTPRCEGCPLVDMLPEGGPC